jgi:hypothetical protein
VRDDPGRGPEVDTAEDNGVVGVELVSAGSVAAEVATASLAGTATDAFVVAGEFWAASCADRLVDFLPSKRAAAPKSVPAITTITAATFQLPVGRFGATDQSGSSKVGGAAGGNGAAGAGASSSNEVLKPLEVSGKGCLEAILPGAVVCSGGTTGRTNEVAGARFGALSGAPMFDADGILVILAGFTDGGPGSAPGTGTRCLSDDGGGCLLGDAVGGTFAKDGVGDWLSIDGTVGCGFSEIASGEI